MKTKLLKSTLLVIIAGILLKLLGFLREITLAYVYGASVISDAFIIAFTIPTVVLAFIGGSMSAVYIPMYYKQQKRADLFTSNIVNLFLLIGLAFSLFITFIPQALVFLFASQLGPETFALASMLLRIMIWSTVPILLAEIYRGYLQIHNAFFRASIANAFVNICVIIAILLSGWSDALFLMGVGAVIGNWLCLAALVISSRQHGLVYHPYLNIRDSSVKELLVLLLPVSFASMIGELNQIVDRNFASSLPVGAISSLNYANKLIGLIVALTGMALATVLFPQMSKFAADNNLASLKNYLTGSLKKLIPILLPITVGAVILAEPVVRLLFERGAFLAEDTRRTAECLQMYAICLVGNTVNQLSTKAFFALRNTKTPAVISAVSVGINIVLNFLLIGPLQHRGLALSTGIAATLAMVLLLLLLRKSLGPLGLYGEWGELLKTVLASALMGAAVWNGYRLLPVMTVGVLQCAVYTALLTGLGLVLYVLLHAILRTEFLRDSLRQLLALLAKRRP